MPNVTFVTVLIGVTVATVLYFIFGTNKQRTQQQYYQYPAERYSEPDNTSKECSICLVPLKRKDLYILPCEHEFHKVCIEEWKNQSPGHRALCPLCRSPFT
ncbi:RING finger protein 122-like isoform X2 [Frieseomelitta varia]|uniref:RING finger protein 122-like isoform X2 n=1 Tax=Frieseomelitta varia TaxID=561572 RepID=UPI001CB67DEB|nr:RING finger protein 122-like isoform X2 [Frieseomelitta varia]